MLSYVEKPEDISAVREILPDADLILKIETQKGLDFARQYGAKFGQLMAARGDLYVEVLKPHRIIGALRTIVEADPNAFVASRIFDSLGFHPVPTSADIGDAAFLLSLGYRNFLLGDIVSLRRDPLIEALNLLAAVVEEFGDT
jgi:pyruvate kinase